MKLRLTAAVGLSAALLLTACAANETEPQGSDSPGESASSLSGVLAGKGASSAKVAQDTWIANFQTANSGVTINYAPDGSGSGREAFQQGGADFAGSDRAFKIEENVAGSFAGCADTSAAINVPIYVSPIAIIFNLDGVDELNLTPEVAAQIFRGDIANWNDPAIAALNPDVTFPDLAITAVHRSDGSGTTENFTDYLSVTAAGVWTDEPGEDWPLQGGEAAKGTAGVVGAVTGGAGPSATPMLRRLGLPRSRRSVRKVPSRSPRRRLWVRLSMLLRRRKAARITTSRLCSIAPHRATRSCWCPTASRAPSTRIPRRARW